MPGQQLGTYSVSGTTGGSSNTCGLGAPSPWQFDVRLSVQGSTLYWDWMDGSPFVSGSLASTKASLTQSATVNADSTDAGLGPCNLQTSSDFTLTLGSGTPPGSFTGTLAYSYTPASGATCGDVLASAGGMYATLPCSLTYTVTGTHQ
jgi:hypothetical protein